MDAARASAAVPSEEEKGAAGGGQETWPPAQPVMYRYRCVPITGGRAMRRQVLIFILNSYC